MAPFWIPGSDSASAPPPVAVFSGAQILPLGYNSQSCGNIIRPLRCHLSQRLLLRQLRGTPIHSCLSGGLILFHFRGSLLFMVPRELGRRPDGRAARGHGDRGRREARVLRRSLNVIYCLRMVQTSGIWKGIGCVNFRFYLPLGHNGRKQNRKCRSETVGWHKSCNPGSLFLNRYQIEGIFKPYIQPSY